MKKPQTSSCQRVGAEAGGMDLQNPAQGEDRGGKHRRHQGVEAIEEHELGIPGQVGNLGIVGRKIAPAGDPADVRPPKAVDVGRVRVLRLVRMLVMVAVVIGPPKRPSLDGSASKKGEQELAEARGMVGLVGEIAVQDARDGEHAHEVQRHCQADGEEAGAAPNDAEASEVEDNERDTANPIHPVGLLAHLFGPAGGMVCVEPLNKGGGGAADQRRTAEGDGTRLRTKGRENRVVSDGRQGAFEGYRPVLDPTYAPNRADGRRIGPI